MARMLCARERLGDEAVGPLTAQLGVERVDCLLHHLGEGRAGVWLWLGRRWLGLSLDLAERSLQGPQLHLVPPLRAVAGRQGRVGIVRIVHAALLMWGRGSPATRVRD
jgi:hypothetical protein